MNVKDLIIRNWPMHVTVLVIIIVSESIGTIQIPLGPGNIMFLPMLYAMALGLIAYLAKPIKFIGKHSEKAAGSVVVLGISIFMAKIGITSGAAIGDVVAAGPALILQEFGNLGTIVIALPLALILGFKREAIGMTHSIAREPNVGLIASEYGLDSPEGRGVMITYIVGTLIGTIFMGLMASVLASFTPLHPFALAMATGVGSGSMMAAASAALVAAFPDMATQITAYAATSNVLSTADGVFMTILIGLPMCNFLYRKLEPILGRNKHI